MRKKIIFTRKKLNIKQAISPEELYGTPGKSCEPGLYELPEKHIQSKSKKKFD